MREPSRTAQQGNQMLSDAGQIDGLLASFRRTAHCLGERSTPTGNPVTADDIAAIQANIAANGLPAEARAALSAEGATDQDVADFASAIGSADPGIVAMAWNAMFGPRPRGAAWQALQQAVQ